MWLIRIYEQGEMRKYEGTGELEEKFKEAGGGVRGSRKEQNRSRRDLGDP